MSCPPSASVSFAVLGYSEYLRLRGWQIFVRYSLCIPWPTSWSTRAATCVICWWIEECPHKGVALNDGTCTYLIKCGEPSVGYPPGANHLCYVYSYRKNLTHKNCLSKLHKIVISINMRLFVNAERCVLGRNSGALSRDRLNRWILGEVLVI